jgi:hypothetical protein
VKKKSSSVIVLEHDRHLEIAVIVSVQNQFYGWSLEMGKMGRATLYV